MTITSGILNRKGNNESFLLLPGSKKKDETEAVIFLIQKKLDVEMLPVIRMRVSKQRTVDINIVVFVN